MSEYQYLEFQAVDRPLTDREMDELRQLSTRAEITRTSFTNEYHYGDFRGDIRKVLTKYFDAFVYVANWGTHRLLFRFPRRARHVDALRSEALDECVDVETHQDVVVLEMTISLEESPGGWEEGEGWLDDLLPLRADILAGDYRSLYLAWLAGVSRFLPSDYEGEDEDEEDEYAGL